MFSDESFEYFTRVCMCRGKFIEWLNGTILQLFIASIAKEDNEFSWKVDAIFECNIDCIALFFHEVVYGLGVGFVICDFIGG